ncbi:MAG: TonB-dependent receptor [Gammaproteobacteria bacterium PRO9]|nr:TonB-dependent receptor [Gammaproteobacteria bacterium PRO9]
MSWLRPAQGLCVFLLGLAGTIAQAQSQSQSQSQVRSDGSVGSFNLGKIEVIKVTADRLYPWFNPLNPTISTEDLRQFDRQDVAQAVRLLPGVNVQSVGARNEQLVLVRGFNSRQVPLFIDGIPVYVPYDGNIDLSRLTTADVSGISVTKGFTSMLFGANTLGGSINVVTRRPTREVELDAGATVGLDRSLDQNSENLYLNAGTNQGRWYAQLGTSFRDQDYFQLPSDFSPAPAEDGGRRDNSATRDFKVSLRAGYTPNETDEYTLSYQNQQGEKGTPPYAGMDPGVRPRFWKWPYYDKESVYFIGRKGLGDSWYAQARAYYDTFRNGLNSYDDDTYTTQNRPYAFSSNYDDYSWGSGLEIGTTAWRRHDLRMAAHYKVDVHREVDEEGATPERYEDEWFSIGIEDRYKPRDAWTLLAGLSADWLNGKQADDIDSGPGAQFPLTSESAVNAQAGVLYGFSKGLSGRVSVSRRTRFPTIKDRYSFRLGSAIPNPGLTPEEAVNLEVGLDGRSQPGNGDVNLSWSVALFHSAIDDAIESVTIAPTLCASAPCFQLQNIGEQTSEGAEAMVTADLGTRWSWHLSYTFVDKDNDTNPGIKTLDVPRRSLFSYLRFMPTRAWELQASVEYGSKRYSTTTGDRVARGFTTTTAKAVWKPVPHLQLETGVRNLTDELYGYEEGFYEPGRNYFATVRWQY